MKFIEFIKVVEYLLIVLFVLVLVTQVLIPAWRGQRLFPMFGKSAKLEKELADAKQEVEEKKMEATIRELRSK